MKRVAGVRGVTALVALLLTSLAGSASAQGGALITGRVTNEAGNPLANANVFVQALNIGAQTGANGTYSISVPASRVNGEQTTLSARFIGFVRQNQQIRLTPGTQSVNFTLRADPFRLEEVITTGVASATSSRVVPFSVAKVSEEQLRQVPSSSPVAALAGKVSGVKVALGNGNPGSPPSIRLRGSTSLGIGTSAPLVLVDGVITRQSIADFDANDIASIEVLKGAAAASFYGSDAANGVINITTKRGKDLEEGKLDFQVRSEYGNSSIANFVPLNTSHNFQLNADGSFKLSPTGARIPEPDGFIDNPYPSSSPFRNQLKTWLTDGKFYSTNVQMGLRRGMTNFNTSFTTDHNQGILPMTAGQFRQNLRLNVDQGITDKVDFSTSLTYGINKNDYPLTPTSSQEGVFFALLQAPPDLDLRNPNGNDTIPFFRKLPTNNSPSARGNPLYELANNDYNSRRERLLGSFSGRYRPFSWLRLEGSYGTDRLNRRDRDYDFRGYLTANGSPGQGALEVYNLNTVAENKQLNATATKLFPFSVLSTTRLAYVIETVNNTDNRTGATRLNITQVPDLGAADPNEVTVTSNTEEANTINYQASQNFTIKDRYIVDAQVRRDGSSLFGPEARYATFYRVAGAYVISEDFRIPGIQELRIRAARGTAGLRPSFTDQYETFTIGSGLILSPNQLGNKALRPAIQTENEFGMNVGFLDRVSFELVQANRKTDGAFINVTLSAAAGGFTSRVENAADVEARTTEASLQVNVIERPNLSYSIGLTGDRTRQKITRLNRPPFLISDDLVGQGQGVFYYKEGEPLGIIYGQKWVRSFEELKRNPANSAAVESDYVVNPMGFLVLKANRGKPNEAPIAYVEGNANGTTTTKFAIGDVNPDYSFGFSNNVRMGGLGLYALFDGQQGGKIYNFTKQWMFQDLRHGDEDQSAKPADQKIAEGFYSNGLYNGLQASDHFVEDGSYVKLRELSLSYDVAGNMLQRTGLNRYARSMKVALIGRNLKTWTNYTGFDPEVTAGNDFNFRIDGFRYPQFRTITGQVTLGF